MGGEGDMGGGMDWGWGGEGDQDRAWEGVGVMEGEARMPGAVEEDEEDDWVDGPLDSQEEVGEQAHAVTQQHAFQHNTVGSQGNIARTNRRRRNAGTSQVEARQNGKRRRQEDMKTAAMGNLSA